MNAEQLCRLQRHENFDDSFSILAVDNSQFNTKSQSSTFTLHFERKIFYDATLDIANSFDYETESCGEEKGLFFGPFTSLSKEDIGRKHSKKRDSIISAPLLRKSVSCSSVHLGSNYFDEDSFMMTSKFLKKSRSMSRIQSAIENSNSIDEFIIQKRKQGSQKLHTNTDNINMEKKEEEKHVDKCILSAQSRVTNVEDVTKLSVTFDTLFNDVKLLVFSFLNISELRSVMATSYKNFALCRSRHLWLTFCHEKWNIIEILEQHVTDRQSVFDISNCIIFQDDSKIPVYPSLLCKKEKMPQLLESSSEANISTNEINFSVLYKLTSCYPSKIDDRFFSPKKSNYLDSEIPPQFRKFSMIASTKAFPENRQYFVVQFTSAVGYGNRCIRSKTPFPPTLRSIKSRRVPQYVDLWSFLEASDNANKSLLANNVDDGSPVTDILKRAKTFERTGIIDPFVYPVVTKIEESKENGRKDKIYTMDITPRLLAYFEISIINRDEVQEPSEIQSEIQFERNIRETENVFHPFRRMITTDCVAIGVSKRNFSTSRKMPGWDRHSYGYHGDDGGLFHGGGHMMRTYGPKFGVGDTVGCGVEYNSKGVFFTLNGKFLGYGWTGIDSMNGLYPTIGVDTNHPIEVNFGSRPFAYDMFETIDNIFM